MGRERVCRSVTGRQVCSVPNMINVRASTFLIALELIFWMGAHGAQISAWKKPGELQAKKVSSRGSVYGFHLPFECVSNMSIRLVNNSICVAHDHPNVLSSCLREKYSTLVLLKMFLCARESSARRMLSGNPGCVSCDVILQFSKCMLGQKSSDLFDIY